VKENDCHLFAQDHMGHGSSSGLQGLITGAQQVKLDIINFIKKVLVDYPNVPFFVMGESMGGLLSVLTGITIHVDEKIPNFKGLILIAPACDSKIKPPDFVVSILTTIAKVGPTWSLGPGLEPHEIWRTKEDQEAAAKDNFRNHGRIRLQTGQSLLDLQADLLKRVGEIDFPFISLHGAKDGTIPVSASEILMNKSKTIAQDKKLVIYPEANHDLLHDPDTPKVLEEIGIWINSRLQ